MSKTDEAQLIAGLALGLMTLGLAVAGRQDLVATQRITVQVDPTTSRTFPEGSVVPRALAKGLPSGQVQPVKRSWLGAILVGTDHRTSTSKTVVYAWTLAVAFGLLSLLVAKWLGDPKPWDLQVGRGLQDEYLLLLGGPFAAAVLAKYAATSQSESKPDAPVGGAGAAQLIGNDQGDTDLGDFQYVLFNAIGLAFFLGAFIGDLAHGFPDLPKILTGLVLTSTGGYSAKKLIAQAAPTLSSVVPAAAEPGHEIQVYGTNLAVPASVSGTGQSLGATVLVGAMKATVSAHDLVLGNDRLTLTVPDDAPAGSAPISAVRADGVAARTSSGVNVLPFTVLPRPVVVD
jgi:hypothetical protein